MTYILHTPESIEYPCQDGNTITIRKELILQAQGDYILFDDSDDRQYGHLYRQFELYIPPEPRGYIYAYNNLYLAKEEMPHQETILDLIDRYATTVRNNVENDLMEATSGVIDEEYSLSQPMTETDVGYSYIHFDVVASPESVGRIRLVGEGESYTGPDVEECDCYNNDKKFIGCAPTIKL